MSRVITVANSKGGAGKSLISMLIAEFLGHQRLRVVVVDADPQATAARWATRAAEGMPFPATVVGMAHAQQKLPQMLKPLAADYDFLVIDTPPAVASPVTQAALLVADVCVLPLQPTAPDLWSTEALVGMINSARRTNDDLQVFAVANRVTRTKLCSAALSVLREDSDLTVLDATLAHRSSYQEAPMLGSAPARMKGAQHRVAGAESEALVQEILSRMGWLQ